MVHISDGILSAEVLIAGWTVTGVFLTLTLRKMKADEIPRISLITAVFFVASLVHIPLGMTSVHLILNGLAGILLGILAYPSIFIGLVLQAFLLGHGGITTIGVNAVNMGIPALFANVIFKFANKIFFHRKSKLSGGFVGGVAGGFAVFLTTILTSLMLITTGKTFMGVVGALIIAHIPVIVIEAVVVGSIVTFLIRVKPEMLKPV